VGTSGFFPREKEKRGEFRPLDVIWVVRFDRVIAGRGFALLGLRWMD
jgi:hypothetical protein